jgi:CheY-like chemotaxis protein
LEFFVEDTGIGIPESQQQVIFESFRQADHTNARSYEGTGLGLAIARSLSRMMGGDITLKSVENIGSTFRFTIANFPIAEKDEPLFETKIEKKKTGLFTKVPFRKKVVMIVQPDVMTYMYYEKLLANTGVTLIHVQTATQWMETVSSQGRIDLVLAGVDMFKDETPESIRQMKSFRSEMPLILVTPRQNKRFESVMEHSMCNQTIIEPVTSKKLITALGKFI